MSYDTGSIMMIVGVLKDTLKKLKKAEERMAIKDDAIRELERSLRSARDENRALILKLEEREEEEGEDVIMEGPQTAVVPRRPWPTGNSFGRVGTGAAHHNNEGLFIIIIFLFIFF